MLNSISKQLFQKLQFALILSALLSLYACMPASTPPAVNSGNATDNPTTPNTGNNYGEPTYPRTGIFVQEGATLTNTVFSLPVDFTDTFLIRGDALSKYLRTVPQTTKICLVAKYTYTPRQDRFLIMSAKPQMYTDFFKKTTEFYLQVDPDDEVANQNDCLSYNLTNTIYSNAESPSAHYSLKQLCSNCNSGVTSSGFRLYFYNGEEVPTVSVNSLMLTIAGSTYGGDTGNACIESSACVARGFDCCLSGQCVKDRTERPGAWALPGYASALEDVKSNPERYVLYPQIYFVCESKPSTTGGSTGGGSTTDPDYDAAVRLMEFKHLYDCINPVDGEFAHCTLKYPSASTAMPGIFSAENDGYKDDINFSNLNTHLKVGDKINNIYKIVYGGQTVYEQDKVALPYGSNFVAGTENDDLDKAQAVKLALELPANARDANLYITYKVDGTCEKISSTLTKCVKTYIHNSSDQSSTYWHDNTPYFDLPSYADLTNIIVKVSGVVIAEGSSTWKKETTPKKRINFSGYTIYPNQTVEITYFVMNNYAEQLVKLRSEAQSRVNTMCACSPSAKCNLRPIMDANNTSIVNYECTYPTSSSDDPPTNQTVYVSNKNVPHRYFDRSGVSYDEDYSNALDQELDPFSYTNNDPLKPNNVSAKVGFNEIYGSFSRTGSTSARPAKLVRVKKDKLYDIVVNSGSFSSCPNCGSDYYSSLQKIFPSNFSGQGGGYAPDNYASSRENNQSLYRADDLAFGRACFVPATMIPWTHVSGSTPHDQRRNRLAAQHFLFANGYNRDWYGFDYGSLIGSFDGVTWFSIGNQRRIKATTNKLFLAVNAYVGDLSVDNNFNVNVSESTSFSSSIPDHDTESDGAQCQRSHFCSNDNDCFRQLGYDYSCQNVAGLMTSWPQFDGTGTEVVGSVQRTLASIVGGTNSQSKRCVYRGRGTPCLPDLNNALNSNNNYNDSGLVGHLMCSPNNSCTPLTTAQRFNDRIARFATTPAAQNTNNAAPTKTDTVGLGARIILRPFDYYGKESVPSTVRATLGANKVTAVCTPGRDVNNAVDTFDLNKRLPGTRTETSDKIFGVGPASSLAMTNKALMACPATDAAGNNLQLFNLTPGDPTLDMFTISQNMSSNLLNLTPLVNQKIYSVTGDTPVTQIGYQKNACLRAPGASCFTDMECAPSTFIAGKVKATNLTSLLNQAEIKFWEEELVCGNPDFKYVAPGALNPEFDLKKNKCCREFGKTMTVYTQTNDSSVEWCDDNASNPSVKVAGVNQNISSFSRYSRVHTVYDKMTCDRDEITSNKTFALSLKAPNFNERWRQIQAQYKTLDTLNQRTCCTGHWVRSFATENGGGHAFGKSKAQNIDKHMFRDISWLPDMSLTSLTDDPDGKFECADDQYMSTTCEIKSLTPTEEENYLTFAGSLELVGIPQVAIKSTDDVFRLVDNNQAAAAANSPLVDSDNRPIMASANNSNTDFRDAIAGKRYYSAANYSSLNIGSNGLKKVFSENEFNCCIPSGQEVPATTTNSQCCTGFSTTVGEQKRCCLPDYTNLTVYLNRYVSSEGRGLPDSAYDPVTGYIKDPAQVQLIAAQKNLCCSGTVMTGVAISQLPIPLPDGKYKPGDAGASTRRFNYRSDDVDNNPESGSIGSIFDAGVRWNNHVYCVPAGFGN